MKKLMALLLACTLSFSLAACNVQTRDDVEQAEQGDSDAGSQTEQAQTIDTATVELPEISILTQSTNEKIANIVRDQLTKNGFTVTINLQPDYSSFRSMIDNHNYDLAISSWTTVTGNPDYAVRSLFKTGADYNMSGIADSHLDDLVEKAASETPAQYQQTYTDMELYAVDEMAYMMPLYRAIKSQGVNLEVLKPETVRISQARSMVWEDISFQDESRNEVDPLITAQLRADLTNLDPIKGNDGSINMLNTNMYIRIVNLTDDDQVIAEGSLSYNYVIQDDNSNFYFVLKDNVNFAKVENLQAVDTGVRVGGEDVVYSLTRANDPNSVPDHRTYSLHESMKEIQIITDITELENNMSANGKSIIEELAELTPTAIDTIVESKNDVDNANGIYQVVKVTTNNPFPQVLNYLAHQSAGIVCAEQVESINTYDIATYDITKDVAYGDVSTVTEGPTYDNQLWCSGPYIMLYKDDYGAYFERNPGYLTGTDHYPTIKYYTMRFIADMDSQLSAFRAGEIYVLYNAPEEKFDLIEEDDRFQLQKIASNGVYYAFPNLVGSVLEDVNLRQAILYSINQDEINAVFAGNVYPAYTTLSPLVNTGNVHKADAGKVAEALARYAESQQ